MKLFVALAMVLAVTYAEKAVPNAGAEKKSALPEAAKETVEERAFGFGGGFAAPYGGGFGPAYGGGYGVGGSEFGGHQQAQGFNQGSNKFANANQFGNTQGFRNVEGFRETGGFSTTTSNQFGSGFNQNVGGFKQQAGGFGNQHGSYRGGFGTGPFRGFRDGVGGIAFGHEI